MGAEQSSLGNTDSQLQDHLDKNHDSAMNGSQCLSVPNSPQPQCSKFFRSLDGPNSDLRRDFTSSPSLTPREFQRTLTNIPGELTVTQENRKRGSGNVTIKHGPGQIVVVNPGRSRTSSQSMEKLGCSVPSELKRLNRIPLFEPLITNPTANINTLQVPDGLSQKLKYFHPHIKIINCELLTNMFNNYEKYLNTSITNVALKQTDIMNLQNKIDGDLGQLMESLRVRQVRTSSTNQTLFGIHIYPWNSPRKQATSNSSQKSMQSTKSAGSNQIESIVLQTSQLTGLISQSTETTNHLIRMLNHLNDCLPEPKRLHTLKLIST